LNPLRLLLQRRVNSSIDCIPLMLSLVVIIFYSLTIISMIPANTRLHPLTNSLS
jgi:hypothetical protein